MIEIVYTWPDGREEVRYRRVSGSPEAFDLIGQVRALRERDGDSCPYSWRDTEHKSET